MNKETYFPNPLEEFEIFELITFGPNQHLKMLTNSSLILIIGVAILITIHWPNTNEKLINKKRINFEILYSTILKLVKQSLGDKKINGVDSGGSFIGLIYGLFTLILISNLLGLIPYSFTITSHFILTLSISIVIVIAITIIGFKKQKMAFWSILIPEGTPLILTPLLVILELISYISKGISLGVRLAANMLAGHILLAIISSSIIIMGFIPLLSTLGLPLIILSGFICLELGIAILQSYVFTILTCLYIKDSIHSH